MNPSHKTFRTIQNYWISPNWLKDRMLFLSGPRQVGKTTLVRNTLCKSEDAYFNWDNRKVRLAYSADPDFFVSDKEKWICFDEIHKRPKWKDILKGIYDTHKARFHFVVTGSASLDAFKKSGDSLVGRYFHTHLFPLNLPDFHKTDFKLPDAPLSLIKTAAELHDAPAFQDLLMLGGFPEPFFSGSEAFWKRWSFNHRDLIIQEDLRDLTRVVEVDKIDLLLDMLVPSIGSTVSYRNLALDLETNHANISRWLKILSVLQLVFPLTPYSKNIRRAFRQEKKWYFMDWRLASENRFENFVAASLWRAVTLYQDRYGERMSLHFIRTHDGQEVDFLICKNKLPWLLIEAKEGAPEGSHALSRFSSQLQVPGLIVTSKPYLFKKMSTEKGEQIYAISWSKFGQVLA